MFYSETLLSKTGPLARVWLSANLERKLSKTHILQSNIESSVSAIVDQGQAFIHVDEPGDTGKGMLYISDEHGILFSESLRTHMYPDYTGAPSPARPSFYARPFW